MIEVENLTRFYGPVRAVNNVNFQVARGEIVGFLGPNGAGKSTTMRVITGYLPATSGTARVAGYDVFYDSLEVRRRIGYMPETVPLYPEMTVQAYLNYMADLRQLDESVAFVLAEQVSRFQRLGASSVDFDEQRLEVGGGELL